MFSKIEHVLSVEIVLSVNSVESILSVKSVLSGGSVLSVLALEALQRFKYSNHLKKFFKTVINFRRTNLLTDIFSLRSESDHFVYVVVFIHTTSLIHTSFTSTDHITNTHNICVSHCYPHHTVQIVWDPTMLKKK